MKILDTLQKHHAKRSAARTASGLVEGARRALCPVLLALACTSAIYAQGRPVDLPVFGGDAQRSGWEKSDSRITRDNVKDFQVVFSRKLGAGNSGLHSLTPPVVIGQLISYKGFKELAFVEGAGDKVWAIDADLERDFWTKTLAGGAKAKDNACAGVVSAMPALTPPVTFGGRPRPAAGAAPAARPATPAAPDPSKGILGGTGFGAPRPVFGLSNDGKIHIMNTSTGEETMAAIQFLPANAKASPLTIADGTIYTTTSALCGDSPNAVWALDLTTPAPKVSTYALEGMPGGIAGLAVSAMDGTIYVQAKDKLIALNSKDLAVKKTVTLPGGGDSSATPIIFTNKEKEYVLAGEGSGKIAVLDAGTLEVVSESAASTTAGHGVWGGFSSWTEQNGTRWVYAPVWGPVGDRANGAIVAYKMDAKLGLTQAWVSADMLCPVTPVLTGGMVFGLAAGGNKKNAVFHAFDAATGAQLFTSGSQIKAPGQLTGMSIVNARVYFATTDNTLQAYGVFLER